MYKNILVPVAGDHKDGAAGAMRVAESLLDEGGRITLLTVLEAVPGFVQTYMPEEIFTKNRSEALEALGRIAAKSSAQVSCEVVSGHSGRTIVNFADSRESDLIILTSHRPEAQDYIFGSTAAWVVRHASCSLHVLR